MTQDFLCLRSRGAATFDEAGSCPCLMCGAESTMIGATAIWPEVTVGVAGKTAVWVLDSRCIG